MSEMGKNINFRDLGIAILAGSMVGLYQTIFNIYNSGKGLIFLAIPVIIGILFFILDYCFNGGDRE